MKVKNEKSKVKSLQGMSLLEIIVVVAIFAILGIITTRAVILTLSGSKKSETQVKVRENLDFAMGVIERQIRNADAVSQCPNSNSSILNYTDQNGITTSFSCINLGGSDPYVASGSARLTSSEVAVTTCKFTCQPGNSINPPSVSVSIELKSKMGVGVQATSISSTTQIFLRNY